MSENELELINMIRESEDPAKAMVTAIEIICKYIEKINKHTLHYIDNSSH